jgi:two-component system chemotaxis response regulator CheB
VADEVSVLIVDDSALMRNLIGRMVEATPGLVIAEKAMNGRFALDKIPRVNPDVIVLDLEMPEMNGIEFLQERKRLGIKIPVVILSSIARRGAEITMEALSLGASDFIQKPSGSVSEDLHLVKDTLVEKLLGYGGLYRRLVGKKVVARG